MDKTMFEVGQILKVSRGPYWHYGVFAGGGLVIDSSKKHGVSYRTLSDFTLGAKVIPARIEGPFRGHEVLERAKMLVGLPYDLFRANCEQFSRWCVGLDAESVQLQKSLLASSLALLASFSKHPVARTAAMAGVVGSIIAAEDESPLALSMMFAGVAACVLLMASE